MNKKDRKNKSVEKVTCEFCGHHKQFKGNLAGQNIIKCCTCKREVKK